MSKSRKKFDNQVTIFEVLRQLSESEREARDEIQEGQLKMIDRLRSSLRSSIKSCPLSVHQIAGEMSHLLDTTVTGEMIYSWTRESDEMNGRNGRHVPAEYLPAFCHVTGSHEPLRLMCQIIGLFVLPGPEALRAEIQKIDEELTRVKSLKRKRMMFLREMECDARNGNG